MLCNAVAVEVSCLFLAHDAVCSSTVIHPDCHDEEGWISHMKIMEIGNHQTNAEVGSEIKRNVFFTRNMQLNFGASVRGAELFWHLGGSAK